jgi:hypothetical protein
MRNENVKGETFKASHAPPTDSRIFPACAPRAFIKKYSTAGALAGAVDSSPRIIHVRADLLRLKAYAYYVVR